MQNIRNIAIIAHVDHGKTTLVDKMLLAGNLFRENQQTGELMLDNNELERDSGITILSKNVSINYKGTKNQYYRHTGTLRLRRRSGTCAEYGRRLYPISRRIRRPDASDAFCVAKSTRNRSETHRGHQQSG